MITAKNIKMGVYRHYKGKLYQVLGLAHDANRPSRICVLYIGLQLDDAHEGPRLAVRTLTDFTEWIGDPAIPRFQYLGPEFTKEMLTIGS